ncbi:MAG: NTP transferase domain-containing protein, partial [Pseudomonadota bacterium]
MTPITAIILAAGEGTRMKSATPKPLHKVGGRSLLAHAMASASTLSPHAVTVVVGSGAEAVEAAAKAIDPKALTVVQTERLGTAHAVLAAHEALDADGDAVILYGDTPFISAETLAAMQAARADADVVILGFEAANPTGYGRLITEGGCLIRITEHRDATEAERAITLCNSGVVMAGARTLLDLLESVGNDNAKGEYYLTDIVGIANGRGLTCAAIACDEAETMGVDSRANLAHAEATFQDGARAAAMANGATLIDPETVWFSHDT